MGAPRIANQPAGRPHGRCGRVPRWRARLGRHRPGLVPPAISTKLVLVSEGTSMLRMSRLTDYATVLLAALAGEPGRVQTAASLSELSLAQLAGLEAAPARLPALEREMKAPAARAPVRS